jgi:hypothetical protein
MERMRRYSILPSYFCHDGNTVCDNSIEELDAAALEMAKMQQCALPAEKMKCIADSFTMVTRAYEKATINKRVYVAITNYDATSKPRVNDSWHDALLVGYSNSELLVPLITYVVGRSMIPTLYSNMMYIENATAEGSEIMGIHSGGMIDYMKNSWQMAVEDLLKRCISNAFSDGELNLLQATPERSAATTSPTPKSGLTAALLEQHNTTKP